ncbi:MAG: copper homeostasis protein CutC [Bacteroides sp.]|nr:copper homeostasis protein CutC [Bacteroides sp.]MBD5371548.1 copper homeostasis protein CutC [Bacteroides sp.]
MAYDLKKTEVEVCCADIQSLREAEGLVERVELCAEISGGGITPSAGVVDLARRLGFRSINVLLRPRSGDFIFDSSEISVMEHDIELYASLGATGAVIGALGFDGRLDADVMPRLLRRAHECGLEAVCNRAVDLTPDPLAELRRLIDWGYDRVLTSGGAPSAPEGASVLARMESLAAGRIVIMAGSGVRPGNVRALVEYTGVRAVHSTCHASCEPSSAPGFGPMTSPFTSRDVVVRLLDALR